MASLFLTIEVLAEVAPILHACGLSDHIGIYIDGGILIPIPDDGTGCAA